MLIEQTAHAPGSSAQDSATIVPGLSPAGAPGDPPTDAGLAGASVPPVKPAYPPTAALPTQAGPAGIRYDFNQGARIDLPPRTTGQWGIRLRDRQTGNILFQSENQGARVLSSKRWFIQFEIEIWSVDSEGAAPTPVLTHTYDNTGKDVLIQLPVGTLGDILAWFPYVARFAEVHPACRVTCAMSDLIIPLLRDSYPNIRLLTHEQVVEEKVAEAAYATYSIGLFFDDAANDWQPTDFRHVGLHRTAAYILGVDPAEAPPELTLPDNSRPIDEPYAVIAVQSSSGCKYWTNPAGWLEVVAFLKARGLRVICIDQKPVHGHGLMWTSLPHGAEDETGDRPLAERARWLHHAEVFVGLSSGLAWLAWSVRCPTLMISGFTHPTNEFTTPYRVINWHACNSCWNDPRVRFDHHDFLWCPRHAGTARHFECTRLITGSMVTQVLGHVPAIAEPHLAHPRC